MIVRGYRVNIKHSRERLFRTMSVHLRSLTWKMVRATAIVALVFRSLLVIATEESTCLRYANDPRDKENNWNDDVNVEIPSQTIGCGLDLSVEITVPFALPMRNLFTLQLAQSAVNLLEVTPEQKPLRYRINVSSESENSTVSGPTFKITDVRFVPIVNETRTPAESEVSTSTVINKPNSTSTAVGRPISTECGRSVNLQTVNQSIVGEVETSRGQFPWHVAIFIGRTEFQFRCSGTLVSDTHVITAAKCFAGQYEWIACKLFRVSLGHYRLRDWQEQSLQKQHIRDFIPHPDYVFEGDNIDVDLAVVILSKRVEFTQFIQPICLWPDNSELVPNTNLNGYVVAWGKDEFGKTNLGLPLMSRHPIVPKESCRHNHNAFLFPENSRTFCAGAEDGSVTCNTDNGSGFFLQDSLTGKFFLRGVLSKTLNDRSASTCQLIQYAIYVDLAQHSEWLKNKIEPRPIGNSELVRL